MTDQPDVQLDVIDGRRPLQSKKFVAFLVAEATWKIIIGIILIMGMRNGTVDVMVGSIILACVFIVGFVEAGYIIGQASLDKYLGLAQIAAESGQTFKLKHVELGKKPPLKETETEGEGTHPTSGKVSVQGDP